MPAKSIRFLSLILCTTFLNACAAAKPVATRLDSTPRLAVISAFDAELEKLRSAARISGTEVVNGRTHYLGTLEGHDVVLLLSGYSMVNAAMTTQALFDHFTVKGIVFSGIAGGVNPELQVGDVTVAAQWGNYQESLFGRETATGFDPGRTPGGFKNFGMIFPRPSSVPVIGGAPDKLEKRFWFPVDPAALKTASRLAGSVSSTAAPLRVTVWKKSQNWLSAETASAARPSLTMPRTASGRGKHSRQMPSIWKLLPLPTWHT